MFAAKVLVLASLPSAAGYALGGRAPAARRGAVRAPPLAMGSTAVPANDIQPMYDQILVSLETAPAETAAGILLPSAFVDEETFDQFAKPEPRVGTIVAMGPGGLMEDGSRVPMPPLSVGQEVLIATAAGERVEEQGKPLRESTLYLFRPEEIWCKIDA